jgi:hypothetical protein
MPAAEATMVIGSSVLHEPSDSETRSPLDDMLTAPAQRIGNASQAERLLEHGWSMRGLLGWPNGLLAQAYRRRCAFMGLYPDGRVQMTTEAGDKVIVDPINETDDECPWGAD